MLLLGDEVLHTVTAMLKEFYIDKLKLWYLPKAFKEEIGRVYKKELRDNVYVELQVGDWIDAHQNERDPFLQLMHFVKHKVQMHEILNGEESLILLL